MNKLHLIALDLKSSLVAVFYGIIDLGNSRVWSRSKSMVLLQKLSSMMMSVGVVFMTPILRDVSIIDHDRVSK